MAECISKKYVSTTGLYIDGFASSLEFFDRMLLAGRSLTNGLHYITVLFDRSLSDLKNTSYGKITGAIDKGRGVVAACRFFISLEWIFSFKILWKRDPITGEFEVDEDGHKIFRNWIDIACDIALAIGRFISPILWLERIKAINLGDHAKWLGGLAIAAFSIVTSLSFVRAFEEAIKEATLLNVIEAISNFFDLLAMPWENGLGFESHPALAIAGAIACGLSAIFYIAKELVKASQIK